jgi:hypothetical protein
MTPTLESNIYLARAGEEPRVYTLTDHRSGRTEVTTDPEGVPSWIKNPPLPPNATYWEKVR